MTWAIQAGRQAVGTDVHWATVGTYLWFLVAAVAAADVLATSAFRSYQRSI